MLTSKDIPGIEMENYQGDEISLLMNGLMPRDIDFHVYSPRFTVVFLLISPLQKHAVTFSTIRGRRSSPEEELARKPHVVAFFVPPGTAHDSDMMDLLAKAFSEVTLTHSKPNSSVFYFNFYFAFSL